MPQHQRSGFRWTVRRTLHGARAMSAARRDPGRRASVPDDPQDTQRPLTTLDATLVPGAGHRYRLLAWGPGEPHVVRDDLGVGRAEGDTEGRTSLLYFAHHTDAHVTDAQSPARLEAGERLAFLNPGMDAGHRPQEAVTVQVLDQMVRATNAVAVSPVTGAEMAFCIQTGDNSDSREWCETRWFVDTLDGGEVTPNTGRPDRYEGIQADPTITWAYHPDDPSEDPYGRFGFPRLPGFLDAAIAPFATEGLRVPWLAVMGNHDGIWQGTFGPLPFLKLDRIEPLLSAGRRKPVTLWAYGWLGALASLRGDRAVEAWADGSGPGSIAATPDPAARRGLSLRDWIAELFATAPEPGPVGHGFTEANLRDGTAWWSRPHGDRFQLIGLDTTNHVAGSEGRLGPAQLAWLEAELRACSSHCFDIAGNRVELSGTDRMVVLFSHHNSWTMTNTVEDPTDPGRAIGGEALVELLARYPNVVLWVNGHSHENRIMAHRGPGGPGAGFWEVNTASCIDFGQQARTIEVVDNGDDTMSVLVTVLDHAAPPSVPVPAGRRGGWTPAELASLGREMASNDARWIDPWEQRGSVEDRNTELVLRALPSTS